MARLGWIKFYLDEKTGELKTDLSISKVKFDAETVIEFDRIVGYIAEFRPFLLDYMIVRENFSEIIQLDSEVSQLIFDGGLKHPGIMNIKVHTLCQQKFMNFLFTASSMRDHYKTRIRRIFSRRSEEFKYISTVDDNLMAKFKSFKICHYLRNYAAHHTLPIDSIPSRFSKKTKTEWGAEKSYIIRKSSLMQSRDIKKALRDIFAELPETINLSEIIDEYFRIISQIFLQIVEFFRPKIIDIIQYREAVIKYKSDLDDARPILWHGDIPDTDKDYKVKLTEFSFDEVVFLFKIINEINNDRPIVTHPSSAH